MTIILAIVLVIAAIAVIIWALKSMLTYKCPECTSLNQENIIIPFLPGFRWWCPVCNQTYKKDELVIEEINFSDQD
jgi:hypothetical protein